MTLLIVNGGSSAPKIAGITLAANYFPELRDHRVIGSNAESHVRKQPEIIRVTLGGLREQEAFKGALNRAYGAQTEHPEGDLFVGIENAVIDLGFVADIPLVVVVTKFGEEFFGTGSGIAFPRPAYHEAQGMGFDTTTVGERVAAQRPGVQHTNPHLALTGLSREISIAAGVMQAFGAMLVTRGTKASTPSGA